MPDYPPFTCTNQEAAGDAILLDADGVYVNTIRASTCFLSWYCPPNGYTWSWVNGVDPDDPTTWPDYEPPEDPPEEPQQV